MIVYVGDEHQRFEEWSAEALERGRAVTRAPFGEPVPPEVAGASALLVDVGVEDSEGYEARCAWAKNLLRFRPEQPMFVWTEQMRAEQARDVIELGCAGILDHRVSPKVVADWMHRFLVDRSPLLMAHGAAMLLDAQGRMAIRGDRAVVLSPREFAVLEVLAASPGRVVGREVLLAEVWRGGLDVDERTVDATVSRLRRRLRVHLGLPGAIRTISRIGYVLQPTPATPLLGSRRSLSSAGPLRLLLVGLDGFSGLGPGGEVVAGIHGVRSSELEEDDNGVGGALVIADPREAWFGSLQRIRRRFPDAAVVLLDAGATERELLLAFRAGVHGFSSFVGSVAALPQWMAWAARKGARGSLAPSVALELLPDEFAVRVGGRREQLPRKDFEVLEYLVRFAGQTVTRERLRQSVWGGTLPGDSRSLDIRISHLRRFLRRHFQEGPPSIETIVGIGYRLRR